MAKSKWKKFPHAASDFRYPGAKLETIWSRLHQGDCEPWPTVAQLDRLAKQRATFGDQVQELGGSGKLQAALVDAWRAFHAGDFGAAIESGEQLGALGAVVANKACGVYATYLETDADRARELLQAAVVRGELGAQELPNYANTHYTLAFVLGRYSQRISIIKALSEGHATQVRKHLDRTLRLEPKHADAHIALGLYHAEIIDKVGALAGGLTYGVSKDAAVKHFKSALKLAPESAIAQVEYAHALALLDAKGNAAQIRELNSSAAKLAPADAMERLDIERAKANLKQSR